VATLKSGKKIVSELLLYSIGRVGATAELNLAAAGLSTDERGSTCCYAEQDKFWVQGAPDGQKWEIYTVLGDSQTLGCQPSDGPACSGVATEETSDVAAAASSCC